MKTLPKILVAAAAAAVAGSFAVPASADSVSDFYKRKRITMYIGYTAGGGYDTYARTLARHMGRHIPGKPKIISKNRPGAGSMIITNELYNTLPQDGSVIATFGRGMVMEPLFGTKEAKFDPTKFNWLGSVNNEVSICFSWHTTKFKTIEDTFKSPLIIGGTGPGADTDIFAKVLNNIAGTQFKLVTGYPGGNEILLAVERGELQGRCGYSWSSAKVHRASWMRDKKINILLQMSLKKHPDLPNVPLAMELAKNERDRQVLELVFARQAWGRPFAMGPGVPKERVAALQKAFDETMKDPKFLADTKRQKLEVNPVSGQEVAGMIAAIFKTPQDVVLAAKVASEKASKMEITKAVIPIVTVKGAITKIQREGRRVSFKGEGKKGKLRVSGSRTKITVAGAKAKRKSLKEGMNCVFTMQGSVAKAIACN